MFIVVLYLQDVLAGLLRPHVKRKGAVFVVVELAESDFGWAHAVGGQFSWTGTSRVNDSLDLGAENAGLDALGAD